MESFWHAFLVSAAKACQLHKQGYATVVISLLNGKDLKYLRGADRWTVALRILVMSLDSNAAPDSLISPCPQEYEKYLHDKENYVVLNVPPNYMFQAKVG